MIILNNFTKITGFFKLYLKKQYNVLW